MTELTGKTPDIAQENIEKLKTIFPDVFTEGKIDFEKLQQVLGNYIETSSERYNFTWNGKSQALRLAQTPSLGILRPCKEESKDWDTTENLYIEGDNLEVLKLLQKSYHGKVKMIYIDPPYNTGKDFVYPDNFKDSIENYKVITGQVDSEGKSLSSNSETSGRYHTDWLNMMYPRLRLARNLLTDDGVIFISIDDNEVENLIKLCKEVFGEDNLIVNCIWISGRTSASHFTNAHEYVIGYAKNIRKLPLFKYKGDVETISDRTIKKESEKNPLSDISFPAGIDFECEDKVFPNIFGGQESVEIIDGTMECFNKKLKAPITIRAAWAMKDMIEKWLKGEAVFDQKGQVVKRFFFKSNGILQYEKERGTIHPNSVIHEVTTKNGTTILSDLLDGAVFPFPKPVELVSYLSPMVMDNDIVLDFFSGSATTAHAVMQLNAEDQGKRKFIMVQLPEPCVEKSEAYKAGYKNICEIGKERIRRAGEKIKEEAGLTAADLDIGFKVFKLDTSNIRKWQPDYNHIEQSLTDYVDNYVDGRSELDVVYEIMLKCGLDLTYPIDEYEFDGKKVYTIGFGALMICLADDITTNIAQEMVKLKNQLSPETWKVVFKDNGFKSDSDKTNSKEILKCGGLDEDAFTTL